MLSGVAWQETRGLLGNNYWVEHIVVSHEPGAWNFSENTELSECLVVAKKSENQSSEPTKVTNLWSKPRSSVEALSVAAAIDQALGASLDSQGTDAIGSVGRKYGEIVRWPEREIRAGNWGEPAAFAQTELCRVAYFLARGRMYIPGVGTVSNVPTVPLGSLATLGPDRRDIHDGFALSKEKTEFAAFWGHDTSQINAMATGPNSYLRSLSRAQPGRPKRDANLLWSRAGRVLIAERLWLTTTHLVSLRSTSRLLSNTWWPVAFRGQVDSGDLEKALVLWLNSTFGILTLLGARVETRGAWIELKKPILEDLRVLNVAALRTRQRQTLCAAFDRLQKQPIERISAISGDRIRSEIDAAIATALGVSSDIGIIREMLAQEPIISNNLPGVSEERKQPRVAAAQQELFLSTKKRSFSEH